jgi:hypothetical protein
MFRATEAGKGPDPMGNQADKNRQNMNPNQQPDQRKNPQDKPQDGRQQQAEQNRQPQPGGARPDPNADRRSPR